MARGRLRIELVDRLEAIGRSSFEELSAGRSLMVSWRYLRAVEEDPSLKARYLLAVEGESRLVGVLPCYLWDGHPVPAMDTYDPKEMGGGWLLGNRSSGAEWRPALFIGTRSGYVNEWLLHPARATRRRGCCARCCRRRLGWPARTAAPVGPRCG
ncbi:MAG: hypothetical protein ACP5PW_03195 [Candidatus Dormibacteria bacterium]